MANYLSARVNNPAKGRGEGGHGAVTSIFDSTSLGLNGVQRKLQKSVSGTDEERKEERRGGR